MNYAVKAKPPKKRRKALILVPLIIVLLAGGTVLGLHIRSNHRLAAQKAKQTTATGVRGENSVDYSPSTTTDNSTNEDRKDSTDSSATLNNTSNGTSTTTTSQLGVIINNAVVITNGDGSKVVHVGNTISGGASGSCTLTASQSGQQNLVQTATVSAQNNAYSCGTFNVPTTSFPASGTWNIVLSVTSGSAQGSAKSQVTI